MFDRDPLVLALLGPTGSGKSSAALKLSGQLKATGRSAEIVAVDAFTVYQGMDIGTAKPSLDDRSAVRHHLVDVVTPDTDVTVAWFQQRARDIIEQIHARHAIPVLVGGSGLYWRAVVDPFDFPPTDPTVRNRLDVYWNDRNDEAYAHLRAIDPAAAAYIEPQNQRRVIRALEVIELTGEPFSSFKQARNDYQSIYSNVRVAFLDPDDADLRASIWQRAAAMVDDGLLDEARDLRCRYRLSRTARQAIGYAEAFAVLDGTLAVADLVEAIATRTWRYVRRQRGWFRADPRCQARRFLVTDDAIARLIADVTSTS